MTPDQPGHNLPACMASIAVKNGTLLLQVNDFSADAVISQLLLLDSQSPNKVDGRLCCHVQVLCIFTSSLQPT